MDQKQSNQPTTERWIFSREQPSWYRNAARSIFLFALIILIFRWRKDVIVPGFMLFISYVIWKVQGKNHVVSYDPVNELIWIENGHSRITVPLADAVSVRLGNRTSYAENENDDTLRHYTPCAITFNRPTTFGIEISFIVFEEHPSDLENVRKFREKVILKRHEQAMAYGQKIREERGGGNLR
jgi:hypothetical protein